MTLETRVVQLGNEINSGFFGSGNKHITHYLCSFMYPFSRPRVGERLLYNVLYTLPLSSKSGRVFAAVETSIAESHH